MYLSLAPFLTATMPRARKKYIAVLKYPVEKTIFQDKTGAIIHCDIYTEVGTDKELVQCEICCIVTFLCKEIYIQITIRLGKCRMREGERKAEQESVSERRNKSRLPSPTPKYNVCSKNCINYFTSNGQDGQEKIAKWVYATI